MSKLPWLIEYENWKAKRRPDETKEDLLHEIYRLEHRVNMWREAGLRAKDYILRELS